MGDSRVDSAVSDHATEPSDYWDSIVAAWPPTVAHRLWRAHSDAVNAALLRRWLPAQPGSRILKTDLFDEAIGAGLYAELAARAGHVVGIDVAPTAIRAATERYPQLDARVADVRALPFAANTFDAVLSNSTLDHFDSLDQLILATTELCRVVRPGGRLILTLDNRQNPVVALRTSMSFRLVSRLGIVPYYVGKTCGRRRMVGILERCGMAVQDTAAVMHCPPKLAGSLAARRRTSAIGRRTSAIAADELERYLARVLRFESLGSSPLRYFTGHFVAALAIKPAS